MLLNNHPLLDLEDLLCSHLQVSEVYDLLVSAAQWSRWMSIEQNLCQEIYFQIQSMSNITKCIDKRFAIKNVGRSCLALTFNLNIPKMKTLHAKIGLKERFKVAGYHKTYTIFFNRSTWTYGSVVEASSREWKNGFNLCSSFAILHGTEPVSALIGYTIAIVEPLSILPQKAWPSRFSQLIQGDDYPSKVQKKRSPR